MCAMRQKDLDSLVMELQTKGYCRIRQLFNADLISKTLELSRYWYKATKEQLAENLPNLAKNDPYVWNPQNKDIHFLRIIFHSSLVEKILMYIFNDLWFKQIPQGKPNYILRNFFDGQLLNGV